MLCAQSFDQQLKARAVQHKVVQNSIVNQVAVLRCVYLQAFEHNNLINKSVSKCLLLCCTCFWRLVKRLCEQHSCREYLVAVAMRSMANSCFRCGKFKTRVTSCDAARKQSEMYAHQWRSPPANTKTYEPASCGYPQAKL